MDLCNENDIRALLGRHGFHFSKSLGQNFLVQRWVIDRIAAASGADSAAGVLEIGPGIGPLTDTLARTAGQVAAVELDRRLLPILEETLRPHDNVRVISGDVMKLDLAAVAAESFSGLTPIVCANLPYNITTPVLTKLIDSGLFRSITVMIQREVAKRICAAAGTADYGAFSVYCQYHAGCELLFEVPPDCFLPAPKVTSAVVRLDLQQGPALALEDEAFFFQVVRAAFSLRRKTLLNCLTSAFGSQLGREALAACISNCGMDPKIRGEQLDLASFAALSCEISKFRQ